MPCRDYETDSRDISRAQQEAYDANRKAEKLQDYIVGIKKRLDAATKAACEALTVLSKGKGDISADTKLWWAEHQEQDRIHHD